MSLEIELLRNVLRLDGLDNRPFILIGFALIWISPDLGYDGVLQEYAAYTGDAPEVAHADLCRRLLAAGREIGPEEYFRAIKREVERDYRILTE